MAMDKNIPDMKLTSILKKWMEQKEWTDEIQISDDQHSAWVDTGFVINDQKYRLLLRTDEQSEIFTVTIFSPFNVPPARMGEMARVLNRLNCHQRVGRWYCWDDEDSNPVIFETAVDVKGSKLVPQQIMTLVMSAANAFESGGELFAAVALTKQPIDVLWANFLEEQKQDETEEEESGPSEL
jgi:hypothetical protein